MAALVGLVAAEPAAAVPLAVDVAAFLHAEDADERDELDYVAAGMNGVAQKPIQPDALLNAIRLVLAEAEAETPAAERAAA